MKQAHNKTLHQSIYYWNHKHTTKHFINQSMIGTDKMTWIISLNLLPCQTMPMIKPTPQR